MRYFFLALFIFIPLHVHAAEQILGMKFVDMPVAEWLGIRYKQQVHSVQDLVSLNRLDMCYKQIVGVVSCMNEVGRSPGWNGSKAGALFTECTSTIGVEPLPGEEKGDGQNKGSSKTKIGAPVPEPSTCLLPDK